MKKLLYAIFSIAIFTACIFSVQAEEYDVENCRKNNCLNFEENYCFAACDAEKFIHDKLALCQDENCRNNWENARAVKTEYYLDYYNNKTVDGSFNYSTFDLSNCEKSCSGYGGAGDEKSCKNECLARQKVKECIIESYTSNQVSTCKNNFLKYYDILNGNQTSDFNYQVCKQQCTSSNMKECESGCYAKEKVEQCKKYCVGVGCAVDCEIKYNFYYEQRLNTYDPYSKFKCGDFYIPYAFPQIVRTIIVILQIATPIIIILLGSIDLFKSETKLEFSVLKVIFAFKI